MEFSGRRASSYPSIPTSPTSSAIPSSNSVLDSKALPHELEIALVVLLKRFQWLASNNLVAAKVVLGIADTVLKSFGASLLLFLNW